MERKKKLKTFTSTSDAPYDRHKYKVLLRDGREVTIEDYEFVRAIWHQYDCTGVEVL